MFWYSFSLIHEGRSKGRSGSLRRPRRRISELVDVPLALVKLVEINVALVTAEACGGGSLSRFESGGGGGPLVSGRRGGRLVENNSAGDMTTFVPKSTRFCSVSVWALLSQ